MSSDNTEEGSTQFEKIVRLSKPIEVGDRRFEVLKFCVPKAVQVQIARQWTARLTEESSTRYKIALVAFSAGVKDEVIERIPVSLLEGAFTFIDDLCAAALDAEPDESESKTIKLRTPIKYNGQDVEQITVREPLPIERRKAEAETARQPGPQSELRKIIKLVAAIAGVNEFVIGEMPIDLVLEAHRYAEGFTERGRTSGKL